MCGSVYVTTLINESIENRIWNSDGCGRVRSYCVPSHQCLMCTADCMLYSLHYTKEMKITLGIR